MRNSKASTRVMVLGCLVIALICGTGFFLYWIRVGEEPSPTRMAAPDREMDLLGEGLNQHLAQYPVLEHLDIEKTSWQFYRDGVTPLAARCAAYELKRNPESALRDLRGGLMEQWTWAWRFAGSEEVVVSSQAADPGNSQPGKSVSYSLQGYANANIPPEIENIHLPLEHYHFCYFLADNHAYWGSYVVQSEELLGTQRIFVLKQIVDGEPKVVNIYDDLPTYEQELLEVKALMSGNVTPDVSNFRPDSEMSTANSSGGAGTGSPDSLSGSWLPNPRLPTVRVPPLPVPVKR